jgi:cytochrome c oxidase subunit IV
MVTDSHQHADGKVHAHITPARTYWAIFFGLIVFTVLTVAVSYVHLGPLNLVVAIAIATVKAALVVLYFMHMKYEAKFNVLIFLGSLLFMGIFLAYTMNDTEYRGTVDYAYGGRVDPRSGQFAHGTPEALVAQEQSRRERAAERARQARAEGAVPLVEEEDPAALAPDEGLVDDEAEAPAVEGAEADDEAPETDAPQGAIGADGEEQAAEDAPAAAE